MTEWYELRGQRGCECATPAGRCGRKVTGYINDGAFDKHVCDTHWREYNDRQRKPAAQEDARDADCSICRQPGCTGGHACE